MCKKLITIFNNTIFLQLNCSCCSRSGSYFSEGCGQIKSSMPQWFSALEVKPVEKWEVQLFKDTNVSIIHSLAYSPSVGSKNIFISSYFSDNKLMNCWKAFKCDLMQYWKWWYCLVRVHLSLPALRLCAAYRKSYLLINFQYWTMLSPKARALRITTASQGYRQPFLEYNAQRSSRSSCLLCQNYTYCSNSTMNECGSYQINEPIFSSVSVIPYLSCYASGVLWDHTLLPLLLSLNSRQLVWKWLKPTCCLHRALFSAMRRKKSNRWCSASREKDGLKLMTLAGCGSINRPYLAGDITSGLTKVNWRLFSSNCILKGILWWANSAHNQNVFMELLLLKC